jgi:hypothetical protein
VGAHPLGLLVSPLGEVWRRMDGSPSLGRAGRGQLDPYGVGQGKMGGEGGVGEGEGEWGGERGEEGMGVLTHTYSSTPLHVLYARRRGEKRRRGEGGGGAPALTPQGVTAAANAPEETPEVTLPPLPPLPPSNPPPLPPWNPSPLPFIRFLLVTSDGVVSVFWRRR